MPSWRLSRILGRQSGALKHPVTTVDSSYYLDQLTEDVRMIAFCEEFCPFLLISMSELWVEKEKWGRFSPNSITKGIIKTIVFYSHILENGEAIA